MYIKALGRRVWMAFTISYYPHTEALSQSHIPFGARESHRSCGTCGGTAAGLQSRLWRTHHSRWHSNVPDLERERKKARERMTRIKRGPQEELIISVREWRWAICHYMFCSPGLIHSVLYSQPDTFTFHQAPFTRSTSTQMEPLAQTRHDKWRLSRHLLTTIYSRGHMACQTWRDTGHIYIMCPSFIQCIALRTASYFLSWHHMALINIGSVTAEYFHMECIDVLRQTACRCLYDPFHAD
jgi:hypothetical protein